jgi:hypothetical protein
MSLAKHKFKAVNCEACGRRVARKARQQRYAPIVAAISPGVKIKPIQRLKIRFWVKVPDNPRTPQKLPTKTIGCRGQKSGRAASQMRR